MMCTEKPNILTREGFFDRHRELLQESRNGREAYEKLCDEIKDKYGIPPRYSSYESFKVNFSYHYHKK